MTRKPAKAENPELPLIKEAIFPGMGGGFTFTPEGGLLLIPREVLEPWGKVEIKYNPKTCCITISKAKES